MKPTIFLASFGMAIALSASVAQARDYTLGVQGSASAGSEGLARNFAISQVANICSTRYRGTLVGGTSVSVSRSGKMYHAVAYGSCRIPNR